MASGYITIVLVQTVFNFVDLTWRERVLGFYLNSHVVRPISIMSSLIGVCSPKQAGTSTRPPTVGGLLPRLLLARRLNYALTAATSAVEGRSDNFLNWPRPP